MSPPSSVSSLLCVSPKSLPLSGPGAGQLTRGVTLAILSPQGPVLGNEFSSLQVLCRDLKKPLETTHGHTEAFCVPDYAWIFLNTVTSNDQNNAEWWHCCLWKLRLREVRSSALGHILALAQSGWELGPCAWVPLLPEGYGPSFWAEGQAGHCKMLGAADMASPVRSSGAPPWGVLRRSRGGWS